VVFRGVDKQGFVIEHGEDVLSSGSESVSTRYSHSEAGFVDVVEVVKGQLGKEILESSSWEVSTLKSYVQKRLEVPETGRLGSSRVVEPEFEDIGRRLEASALRMNCGCAMIDMVP